MIEFAFATELSSLGEMLPALSRGGWQAELCPSLMFSLDEMRDYLRARASSDARRMREANVPAQWHSYFYNQDLGAVDARVREYTRDCALCNLQLAAAFGARDVVMHTNYVPVVIDYLFDYWVDELARGLAPLVERAGELGLNLLIENVYELDLRLPKAVLARFPQPHVGLCFDVAHFHVHARAELTPWVRELGARTLRLHLSDNDGTRDQHRALGLGNVPIGQVLPLLRASDPPRVTFEVAGNLGAAERSRNYVLELLSRVE